jgi:hypothetical protein
LRLYTIFAKVAIAVPSREPPCRHGADRQPDGIGADRRHPERGACPAGGERSRRQGAPALHWLVRGGRLRRSTGSPPSVSARRAELWTRPGHYGRHLDTKPTLCGDCGLPKVMHPIATPRPGARLAKTLILIPDPRIHRYRRYRGRKLDLLRFADLVKRNTEVLIRSRPKGDSARGTSAQIGIVLVGERAGDEIETSAHRRQLENGSGCLTIPHSRRVRQEPTSC